MNAKINSLQGLRFIAFLLIFIYHLNGYFGQTTFNFARVAVTFFFVLSGFVSMLKIDSHIKDIKGNTLKQSFIYAKNKISKIYPLYIISLTIFIPLSVKNLVLEEGMNSLLYIVMLVINIFLLESWIPYKFDNIAYAGWFLSTLMFLNFITIPLRKLMLKLNKNDNVLKNFILIIICIFFLFLYSIIVPRNNDIYFFYCFPLYRIFEYFLGMILASIYMKTKENKLLNNKSIMLTIIFTILEVVVIFQTYKNSSIYLSRGFVSSLSDIVCSMFFIFVIMYEKGIISKLLILKPMVFMGDISGEMYIIHNIMTAYFLGILSRILPNNMYFAIPMFIATFILTSVFAYFIHYKRYENLQKKLKTKLIHIIGKYKQKKLKCKDFTIISNNCFAGVFYRNNALEYKSPTCGLFIMPKDYIKFIYNLKSYLNIELKEISLEESNYSSYLKEINYKGTIGRLDDIEIMFLHYKDFKEASKKWERRKNRINYDKIIYKFNDQNGCTYDDLLMFYNFDAKNKLLFTAKRYDDLENAIIFSEFENDGYVLNDSKESIYSKYIDMYQYINERFGDTYGKI